MTHLQAVTRALRWIAASIALLILANWLYPPRHQITVTGPRACDAIILDANGNFKR